VRSFGPISYRFLMGPAASGFLSSISTERYAEYRGTMRSVSGDDYDCDDNECRDQRKGAIKCFRSGLCGSVGRRDYGWVIGHCIPPLAEAGAQNSQSPEEAEEGGDGTSMLFGVRRHRSILLTFKKLMIGKIGRPCLLMGWSGRAPAPPAISWPGTPRQGARHGDEAPEIVIQPSERPQRPQSGK
jgi:hypothetical protein